jgi:MinD-like ATPase involved in chromosome partitioning or flagellar assembly
VIVETISVAIAVPSGETATRLIGMLEGHPLLDFCGAARSLPDLMRLLAKFRPAVLLISPSMLEEMDASLRDEEEGLLVSPLSFLIANREGPGGGMDISRALRHPLRYAGFIEVSSSSEEAIFQIIKRKVELYSGMAPPPAPYPDGTTARQRRSSLIAVMGPKGGVGSTLISCALASCLGAPGRRVLLMDMDSGLSQLLHLNPRGEGKTVLELLPLAEELSWELVRVSVYRHAAGFHLLPYGVRPGRREREDEGTLHSLLRNLLFLFDAVVLDCSRFSVRDYLPLLHHSPATLLVSLPDTLSANCARRAVASLRRGGADLRNMRLIVNRCGSRHILRPQELARAIGVELLAQLPEDERSGLDFAELGELPGMDSPLGKATAQVAAALGFKPDPNAGTAPRPRLLGLVKAGKRP